MKEQAALGSVSKKIKKKGAKKQKVPEEEDDMVLL